jgi:hypothetical protein
VVTDNLELIKAEPKKNILINYSYNKGKGGEI